MLFNGRKDLEGSGSHLRRALLVGGRRFLIGGVASQPERPQPRSLFAHRSQFGLAVILTTEPQRPHLFPEFQQAECTTTAACDRGIIASAQASRDGASHVFEMS